MTKIIINSEEVLDLNELHGENCENIEKIEITYGKLNNIEEMKEKNWKSLTTIIFSNNDLDTFPRTYFPRLTFLNLSYNLINDISFLVNAHTILPELKYLDLSYNLIYELPINIILFNLVLLNLSGNRITNLSNLSSFSLPELSDLRLDNCGIENTSFLETLNFPLITLSLNYNEITIPRGFSHSSLTNIYLNNNRIHDLSIVRNYLPNLEVLDLRDNRITYFGTLWNFLNNIPKIRLLMLEGNPLNIREKTENKYKFISMDENEEEVFENLKQPVIRERDYEEKNE